MKETKKRGRPSGGKPVKEKVEKKVEKGENGEPLAKRGRGRPKSSSGKTKSKVSKEITI